MWCGKCQADVAAEVSPDNQRVFCTVCGALLTMIDTPPARPSTERPASDKTKDARDLLQRWSSGKVLDPFGPPIKHIEPVELPTIAAQPAAVPEAMVKNASESVGANPAVSNSVVDAMSATTTSTTAKHEVASAVSESLATDSLVSGAAEVVTPAVRTAPSPFVVAAMNSSASPVLTPAFASLPLSGLAPVANPLTAAPPSERPVAPIPPSPFSLPAKSAAPMSFPPALPPTVQPPAAKIRIDAAHDQTGFLGSAAVNSTASNFATPSASSSTSESLRDASGPFAVKSAPAQPRLETRRATSWMPTWDPAFWRTEPSASGNWTSAAGQLLAYAGVLGLTIGACMVVWSYYGGPATYAPTGWLIATAGQMLLFFGVVTLVSGGLEQTTEQVNKRIEQLGDHIIRIEQAAREMNARSIPSAHFAHDRDEAYAAREALAESDHERAVVER